MNHRSCSTVGSILSRLVAAAVAALWLIGVVAAPAVLAQESQDLQIKNIDASNFPLIRATVTGPSVSGELDDQFVVVEDGQEQTVDVVRVSQDRLNVIVVVDVSGSMGGAPLEEAKKAVGQLLANLPNEVPVGLIAFAEQPVLVHDFSNDHDSVQAATNGLLAAGGTALYDGVELGLIELSARGGSSAMVVLADGSDTRSASTLTQVRQRLNATPASVTMVALQSEKFDVDPLQQMADSASGDLIQVSAASQLGEVFAAVAAGLNGLYEIRWTSQSSGASADLTISLASDPSQTVSTSFAHSETRQFIPDVAVDTYARPGAGAFDADWIVYAAAGAVSAGAFLLIMLMRTSETAVERREERKEARDAVREDRKRRTSGMMDSLSGLSAQVLEQNDRGRSLDDILDRAGLAMRSNEFVVVVVGITAAAFVVSVPLFGVPFFLLGGLLPGALVPMFLKFKMRRRTKKFQEQLGDTLQLMAGSLTAGYGLGQTLDSVAKETDAPTSVEFQRVVMETRLGRSLEDALDAMSRRLGSQDFNWVVDAIKIQSSVGGNLSEIISQVGDTIRARTRIRRQVDALTAEGRISAFVLFLLPLGLFAFIYTSNPEYIKPMFSSGLGQIMLGNAVFLMTMGGLWLRKLVNPEF